MFGFKNFIKKIWIFLSIFSLAAILLTHGIVISNTVDAPASTTVCDWGIAFDKNNEPPRGNVSAEELKKNNAYFIAVIGYNGVFGDCNKTGLVV